jgi:hypothetical protein
MTDPESTSPVLEVHWRPGSPNCRMLLRPLRRSGLRLREINIWDGRELWVLRSPDAVLPIRCRRRDAVRNRDVRGLVDGTELRADDRRRHRVAVRLACPIVVRYPEVGQCGCGATCVMSATEQFTVGTFVESDANMRARTPSWSTDARVATRNSARAGACQAVRSHQCARCGLGWLG